MPSWVTNKITASPEVIAAIINTEGHVDFNLMAPFPGEFDWNGVSGDAEIMAEVVIKKPLDSHPLIASLQASNRQSADIAKLADESFEQFIQMLRNHRKSGYQASLLSAFKRCADTRIRPQPKFTSRLGGVNPLRQIA